MKTVEPITSYEERNQKAMNLLSTKRRFMRKLSAKPSSTISKSDVDNYKNYTSVINDFQ